MKDGNFFPRYNKYAVISLQKTLHPPPQRRSIEGVVQDKPEARTHVKRRPRNAPSCSHSMQNRRPFRTKTRSFQCIKHAAAESRC